MFYYKPSSYRGTTMWKPSNASNSFFGDDEMEMVQHQPFQQLCRRMGKTTWQAIRRYRSMVANDYFLRSRRPCEWWNLLGTWCQLRIGKDFGCLSSGNGTLGTVWNILFYYAYINHIYIYFIYTLHMYAQFVFAGYLGSAIVPSCRVCLEIARRLEFWWSGVQYRMHRMNQ